MSKADQTNSITLYGGIFWIRTILSLLVMVTGIIGYLTVFPKLALAKTPSQIFKDVKESVMVVKTYDLQGNLKAQGSGVIISSDRVATNCHVVDNGVSYQVGHGNHFVPATIYSEDAYKDICIISAKGLSGKPVHLGKASSLKVGDPVYAIGAPRGLELSLSDGIVAQLRGGPPPVIQTTAAISPGSSGGGLFDREGRLVGLTTLYLEGGQSLNFAMPVEWIGEVKKDHIPSLVHQGENDWVTRALSLNLSNKWNDLLTISKEWTRAKSEDYLSWYFLARAYDELKLYDDAIRAYRQSLSINPKNDTAWFLLGLIYSKLKQNEGAAEAFQMSLSIDQNNPHALIFLGLIYGKLNRHNDAIEAYQKVINIDKNNAMAWFYLANTYAILKKYDNAVEAYHSSLNVDPSNTTTWYLLGRTYVFLNRYDDVVNACHKAISLDPQNADAWFLLGSTYFKLDRYDDAIEAHRQVLRFKPQHDGAWFELASAYALSGNRTAALDAIRELRRLDPERAEKLFNLIVPH